jgi:hypothetical protein
VLATAREVVTQLAASMRVYFFPLLGLVLMRRLPRPYFAIATATFAAGYAISFGFELGGTKWWLARFLAPGIAVALLGGFIAGATIVTRRRDWIARVTLALAVVAGSFGPMRELGMRLRANLAVGTLDQRLRPLMEARGPFADERRRAPD